MLRCYMTSRPQAEEEHVTNLPVDVLLEAANGLSGRGRRILGVGDKQQLVQLLSKHTTVWENLMKRSEVKTATTKALVATYNEITGKGIKKFADRAAAEKAVTKLLPPDEPAAKTAKGEKPAKAPKATKAPKAPKAPKVANDAGDGRGRGRPSVDFTVKFVGGDAAQSSVRENSNRGMVLAEIRKRKSVRRADLDAVLGFESAGYVQKLVEKGHVEVVR